MKSPACRGTVPIEGEGQRPRRQARAAAAESEGRSGWAVPCRNLVGLAGWSLSGQWEAAGIIDWIWLVWATVLFRGEAREEEAAGLLWTREAVAGDGQRS